MTGTEYLYEAVDKHGLLPASSPAGQRLAGLFSLPGNLLWVSTLAAKPSRLTTNRHGTFHHETLESWLRIGMAYGAVQGVLAEDIDSANPIAADRAAIDRLDHLALSDW